MKQLKHDIISTLTLAGEAQSSKEIREQLQMDGVDFDGKQFGNAITKLCESGELEKVPAPDLRANGYRYQLANQVTQPIDQVEPKKPEVTPENKDKKAST